MPIFSFIGHNLTELFGKTYTSNNVSLIRVEKKKLLGRNNNPANIYLLAFNNRNTRKRCEICLNSTTKTPERCH